MVQRALRRGALIIWGPFIIGGCRTKTDPVVLAPTPAAAAPAPKPPVLVRVVLERLSCGNGTDQGLKGPKDEPYIFVAVKTPGAVAFFPSKRKPRKYWQMCSDRPAVGPVELWRGMLAENEEVAVAIQYMEDDNAGVAPRALASVADAVEKDSSVSWLAYPIRGVAYALGKNKDDYLGTTGARVKNVGGSIVWWGTAHTERGTSVDRNQEETEAARGLPRTQRVTFHRKNRWFYDVNLAAYAGDVRIAPTRMR